MARESWLLKEVWTFGLSLCPFPGLQIPASALPVVKALEHPGKEGRGDPTPSLYSPPNLLPRHCFPLLS